MKIDIRKANTNKTGPAIRIGRCVQLGETLEVMKKIFWSILFILVGISRGHSQDGLSPAQLKEDLSILGELVTGLSPKLSNKDRIRIDSLININKQKLENDTLTSMDFFNFLSEIDFQTKFDEHASLSITEEVLMPLLKKSELFPIPIKLLGDHVLVNSTNSEIPFGSKIISIDGVSVDSLLKSFTPSYKDTFIQRRLERQFSIVYLIKKGSFENFTVEYTEASSKDSLKTNSIAGINFETYREVFGNTVFPLDKANLNNLINTNFFEESNTYYLQLNSFNWNNAGKNGLFYFLNAEHKNFEKRFKTIFKEISDYKAKNLIIDLRHNYGGNVKVPGVLYSYIAKQAFVEDISLKIQDFNIPAPELISRISSDQVKNKEQVEKFIRLYKKQFLKSDDGYLWKLVENEEVEPEKKGFKGNVYLLVSGRSVSASAYFTALFKSNNRGLIVGEEMGGSFRSLTAGQTLTYRLPNSKIELEMPIMEVNFSSDLYEKIGKERIEPDIEFSDKELWTYFLANKSVEIEKVLELAREEN